MKEKYPIKGSNTFYKVWGIIVIVLAAILGAVSLLFFIIIMASASLIQDIMYSTAISAIRIFKIIWISIIICIELNVTAKIFAGIALIEDYIKSKGKFIAYAVECFLMAVLCMFFLIFFIMRSSVSGIVICLLLAGWNIATGIILISKSGKADMPEIDGDFTPPEFPTNPPLIHGTIEGIFGEFKGKQLSLNSGHIYKIGREAGCDIQLVHPKVSRVHCIIRVMPSGGYQITDYSYNGTFYENQRLPKNIMQEVEPGGMLVIGEADNVLRLNIPS